MSDLDHFSYDAPAEPTEAERKLDPEQGAISQHGPDWFAADAEIRGFEQSRAAIVAAINSDDDQPEMDMLHAWVLRDPSNRTVSRMARLDGNCIVELKGLRGEYRSETQLTFGSAIRTVLMIAAMEGDK